MRSHRRRLAEGFYERYLSGEAVLDIGFRGGKQNAVPVTEKAVGIELDFPGYDGINLPFESYTQDAVFASHTLEHIDDWRHALAEWFRVLKHHGYLIIAVPHQWLYERKAFLPSRFNGDHKRFYTPKSLLAEIETSLPVGCWRLRSLRDIDEGFIYALPPDQHPRGSYEIELVVEKIEAPTYADRLSPSPHAKASIRFFSSLISIGVTAMLEGRVNEASEIQELLSSLPLPGFRSLDDSFIERFDHNDVVRFLRPVITKSQFDESDYLGRYADVRLAVEAGRLSSGREHYVRDGYFRGRQAEPIPSIFK